MLFVKRFSIAFIISLGLAGSAIASPINPDLASPESLAETLYNSVTQTSGNETEIDLCSINSSYGIQSRLGDFNFLKNDIVKVNDPAKIPEPNSVVLLALGLAGLTLLRRRKH